MKKINYNTFIKWYAGIIIMLALLSALTCNAQDEGVDTVYYDHAVTVLEYFDQSDGYMYSIYCFNKQSDEWIYFEQSELTDKLLQTQEWLVRTIETDTFSNDSNEILMESVANISYLIINLISHD